MEQNNVNNITAKDRWLMVAGNLCLAAAGLSWFAVRHYAGGDSPLDGIPGLFIGLAIGLNLMALVRLRRSRQ